MYVNKLGTETKLGDKKIKLLPLQNSQLFDQKIKSISFKFRMHKKKWSVMKKN